MEDTIVTGVSTSDEFLKAINDKGAELTNESTPYELLDAINKTGGVVTFESTNGEIIEAINTPVVKYTVTYDVNGGTGTVAPVEVKAGESVTLNDGTGITAPDSKVFDSWTTTKDDDSTKVTSPYTPEADVKLYAYYVDAL